MISLKNKSHKNIYFWLAGVLLFSVLFLGSWAIFGPINFRNFSAIVLFLISLLYKKSFPGDKTVKTYFLWLVVYIMVNILSGNFANAEFIRGLLTYHLLSVFAIVVVPRLVNDAHSIHIVSLWILIFYILNSIFTILQFLNVSQAWSISTFISPMSEVGNDLLDNLNRVSDGYLGRSITPGLTGFVVSNGYFLTFLLPYVTKDFSSNEWKKRILSLFVLLLGIYAIFCTQQRMAFYLSLLYMVYVLITKTNRSTKFILLFFMLFYFLFNSELSFDSEKMGRLISFEDNIRSKTFDNFLIFMSDPMNVLFGMHEGGVGSNSEVMLLTMCHNSLLDSVRRGGLFLMVLTLILYFRMFSKCFKYILDSRFHTSTTISLCLSCCCFLIYSLTHSTGLQSGSVECWLLYMLMLSSVNVERNIKIQ